MRRSVCLFMMLVFFLPSVVSAHIVNEQNLYDDLQYSKARAQIVYMSGFGIIPYDHHGSMLFSPQDKLTREDLALWAGTYMGVAEKEATHDDILAAAVKKGLVSSLQGNATYADVNQAYFQGKASLPEAGKELTREEFALFMSEHVGDSIDGKTLYDQGGFIPGPTGKVEKVTAHEEKDASGSAVKVYSLKLGESEYVLSAHPRILQASVDPAEWEGKQIQEAWLVTVEGKQQLQLIQFEQAANGAEQHANKPQAGHDHAGQGDAAKAETAEETGAGFPLVPVIAGILLIVLVGGLLFSRKK